MTDTKLYAAGTIGLLIALSLFASLPDLPALGGVFAALLLCGIALVPVSFGSAGARFAAHYALFGLVATVYAVAANPLYALFLIGGTAVALVLVALQWQTWVLAGLVFLLVRALRRGSRQGPTRRLTYEEERAVLRRVGGHPNTHLPSDPAERERARFEPPSRFVVGLDVAPPL